MKRVLPYAFLIILACLGCFRAAPVPPPKAVDTPTVSTEPGPPPDRKPGAEPVPPPGAERRRP
jgi:hypothetical protein